MVASGTEERRQGLALLVDAVDRLADDHADLHLVLAGAAADDTEHVVARIGAARHRSRIRRLGPVDEFTKGWLLRHAAVLAYPSLDEGFGFPVLEAQRVGVPVVATAVGSIPEIAGEGALLVDGRDPNAFAAAMDESLGGLDRTLLIEAGMRNAERFSWDTTACGLVDLYQRAAGC